MNKEELSGKTKEELVDMVLNLKKKMEGGDCSCSCDACQDCEGEMKKED